MDVTITTSPDKMEAYLKITNILQNEQVTFESLVEAIRNAKIVHNIDYEAIRAFCNEPIENVPILIARGDMPINGEDGKIVFEILTQKSHFSAGTGNKVDFREFPTQRRIIVKKGQKIATIYPPTEGMPGKNVYGEEVPARKGNDAKISLGKNVALSEDGMYIMATSEGLLKVDPEKNFIEVSEYLEIEGDVDYTTGNIDFPGIVFVKGDIKPGFIVRAKGDIEIGGVAEASTVISLEGSVKLSGAKGKEKGLLKAKKNLSVKYAESITIEAENVFFEHNLLNCTVRANNSIVGQGRNSSIIGGDYVAGNLIECDEIGSDMGVKTTLEVGVNPYLREEMKLLKAQIEVDKTSIQKLISVVKQYKELKEKGVKIPPEKEEQFSRATKALINLREQLERNIAKLHEIEFKVSKMTFDSKIIARKILYPGVEVHIHGLRYYAEVALQKVVLRLENDKIVAGGYSG